MSQVLAEAGGTAFSKFYDSNNMAFSVTSQYAAYENLKGAPHIQVFV